MRCGKARDLYFKLCDDLLNEAEKMQLQMHLDECPDCSEFTVEMNRCREMLKGLPEMEPSENFEWNLKRRILQEKARAVRDVGGSVFGNWRWGLKFAASAAAVVIVVLTGTWMMVGRDSEREPMVRMTEGGPRITTGRYAVATRNPGLVNLQNRNHPAGLRMVSDESGKGARDAGTSWRPAYQFAADTRVDSLQREIELLKNHIEQVERENLIFRRLYYQERARR